MDISEWKFLISHHALKRYRERIDRKAEYGDVISFLNRSVLDSRAKHNRFILRGPNHAYFVISETESPGDPGSRWFMVMTVLTKKMVPDYRRRKGYSRRGKKKWRPKREDYNGRCS